MFENLENVVGYKTVVGVHVFTYVLENLENVVGHKTKIEATGGNNPFENLENAVRYKTNVNYSRLKSGACDSRSIEVSSKRTDQKIGSRLNLARIQQAVDGVLRHHPPVLPIKGRLS